MAAPQPTLVETPTGHPQIAPADVRQIGLLRGIGRQEAKKHGAFKLCWMLNTFKLCSQLFYQSLVS